MPEIGAPFTMGSATYPITRAGVEAAVEAAVGGLEPADGARGKGHPSHAGGPGTATASA
ncbi:hypothetical protein ACE1OC_08935 [Streptomyces sp. DSM 116496]|uniref:hypothetical protein n=1 Tax=Streptomyces stoeckheimensis TaxID=3344656 RepID=UPI0038B3A5E4